MAWLFFFYSDFRNSSGPFSERLPMPPLLCVPHRTPVDEDWSLPISFLLLALPPLLREGRYAPSPYPLLLSVCGCPYFDPRLTPIACLLWRRRIVFPPTGKCAAPPKDFFEWLLFATGHPALPPPSFILLTDKSPHSSQGSAG